jgi:undecaprenyl-diphosphatase
MIFGILLPLFIFLMLMLAVIDQTGGIAWDKDILLAIHATVQPGLDTLATLLTELGVYWGVVPAVVAIGIRLIGLRHWRSLLYLVATSTGSVLLNWIAKLSLHRARPHLWETNYSVTAGFAFPSGHAMSSLTLVAILVVLVWNTRWRGLTVIAGTAFVLGVSWSRLYFGVHYPSDIVAGWMLAIAWASFTRLLIYQPYSISTPLPTSSGIEKT